MHMSHTWRSWCKVLFFEVYTFRGVSSPSNAVSSLNWLNSSHQIKGYRAGYQTKPRTCWIVDFFISKYKMYKNKWTIEMKWIVEFFTIAKSERRNHLLKAASKREYNIVVCLFHLPLSFQTQSTKTGVCDLLYSISLKSYITFSK